MASAYAVVVEEFVKKKTEMSVCEYVREGHTYHQKGLWLQPHENSLPSLTMVGSPNFGELVMEMVIG